MNDSHVHLTSFTSYELDKVWVSSLSHPAAAMEKNNTDLVGGTSVRKKRITSCAIWFGTFSFGIATCLVSPALVEFKNKYNTTIDDISKVFTIILSAYTVGALTCGVLINYINRQLIVVGLLFCMSGTIMATPYVPTKVMFFVVCGMNGFTLGGFDTSQIAWMLEIWRGEAGLYIQALYFVFAIGNLLAPMLLKPFLMIENDISNLQNLTYLISNTLNVQIQEESQLYIPFSIGAALIFLAGSSILVLFFRNKYESPPEITLSEDDPQVEEPRWRTVMLVTLSAVALGAYQGMEVCTFQFLATFTHYTQLAVPEPEGALILSAMTGSFSAGRLFGIWASAMKLKPEFLLVGNVIITIAANVLYIIFANENLTVLWVASVMLGFGFSTVFACIYDYIEKHVKVTNTVASIMVVAGGLVAATYPLIIGEFIERSPFVLMYAIFTSTGVCTVAFTTIYYLTEIKR